MADDKHRRLGRFGRLRPPSFSGSESEDAQGFLDKCQWMLKTMDFWAAFRWWEAYERRSPVGAVPLTWQEFSVLSLEKFMPQSHREELRRQFEQLQPDGMSVTQYEMRFFELDRHAVWLVPTDRERIKRLIDGLAYQLRLLMTREKVSSATFDEMFDITRQIKVVHSQERGEREAKRPRGSGGFGGIPSGWKSYHNRGRPYRPTQMTRPAHRGASASHGSYNAHSGQSSFSALPAQSSHHASCAQASIGNSPGHQEHQFHHRTGYFECRDFGHIKRDCLRLLSGAP
ncbi:uncharacterized protein [Nicotiana tomentosiformis]|uniref:uncharacterized protein n=1 Tax=Nicotiana tomentosiformis TaxID=4098 RepID=UPI00388C45E4